MAKKRIAHIITRLVVGGAQENTIFTVEGLAKNPDYEVTLITGPGLGPEGSLFEERWKDSVQSVLMNQMRRQINPLRELS